jgi:hypothetical protein
MITVQIDGRSITRITAVIAATLGVGAAAFFGGQTTRMNDTAVASVKHDAVEEALDKADRTHAAEMAMLRRDAKQEKQHAVRKVRRETRRNERKRATNLAERARNEGYSSGNGAGYASGSAAGHEAGKEDGIATASDELDCSDDVDVTWLPPC